MTKTTNFTTLTRNTKSTTLSGLASRRSIIAKHTSGISSFAAITHSYTVPLSVQQPSFGRHILLERDVSLSVDSHPEDSFRSISSCRSTEVFHCQVLQAIVQIIHPVRCNARGQPCPDCAYTSTVLRHGVAVAARIDQQQLLEAGVCAHTDLPHPTSIVSASTYIDLHALCGT